MGTKVKCLKCGNIIEGDRKGNLISCQCGSCYIDETPYYVRIGGDPEQMMSIDDNGNEKPMTAAKEPEVKNKQTIDTNVIYIFLDVDGVLNDETYTEECWGRHHKPMHMNYAPFDPKCLNNLMVLNHSIINADLEPKFILSSTWRLSEIDTEIVKARLAEYGVRISDVTPFINGERGKEIQEYIDKNPIFKDYIIIDDDSFDIIDIHSNKLVNTKYKDGFTSIELARALKLLGVKRNNNVKDNESDR